MIDQAGELQHQIKPAAPVLHSSPRIRVGRHQGGESGRRCLQIFIELAKCRKDRYILFPDSFKLILKSLAANPRNRYLFESRQRTKYPTRRIEQIVAHYAQMADLREHVHPHLLRHQMLT